MPLDKLRERHRALGTLEELPGERTILSRCATFGSLLANGATCAELIREAQADLEERGRDPAEALADHPELSALVLEAWPE
jgi:hypothetical protein